LEAVKEERGVDFDKWIRASSIIGYVTQRQNDDGGYTFAQWSESSAQDTYYALRILNMLRNRPPRSLSTVNFLKALQFSDGSFDSVKVAYYVTRSLKELGATPERGIEEYVLLAHDSASRLGSFEVNIEAASDIETLWFSLETLRLLGKPTESEAMAKRILNLRNQDGSFGKSGYSRLASVYYALGCLKLLGYKLNSLHNTHVWIRACENPSGGFGSFPNDFDAYLILEDTYYGLKALELLGETCQYPFQNLQLIGKFQNANGGFRRSIFLGISTFEDTFYALSSIETLTREVLR
jgi:hypothetical protein